LSGLNSIYRLLHYLFLWRLGFGNRLDKKVWDTQFKGGSWDYLYSEDEKEHYLQIIRLREKYRKSGSILDIGCGLGTLYSYIKNQEPGIGDKYTGIDISEEATKKNKNNFTDTKFLHFDYQLFDIADKYDVIIYNETLYYFTIPQKTFLKSLTQNLNEGGIIIVSMCSYRGHDNIWKSLDKYTVIESVEVNNSNNQKWVIKAFKF
jgi:2-polyprenyl-3-methyl-5-hydroxy-6-metoxy-1,4-benzoquinol methylase